MTEIQIGLKERAATWIINRVASLTNSKVDIKSLQQEFHANEGRVTRMTLTDIGKSWHFRVKDGRLEMLPEQKVVDGGFEMSTDILVEMARGKQRRMNPATREQFEVPFSPIDAVAQGRVRIYGEAASNDLLLFARAVLRSVWPKLQEEVAGTANGANKHVAGPGRNGGVH